MGFSDLLVAGINKGNSVKFAKQWKNTVNKCKLSFYNDFIKAYNHIEALSENDSMTFDDIINTEIEAIGNGVTPIKTMNFHLKKNDEIYNDFEKWCSEWSGRFPDSLKALEDYRNFYNKLVSIKEALTQNKQAVLEDYYIKARAEKDILEKEGVDLNKDNKGSMSWGLCLGLLVLLPPIGIICIILKLTKKKKK